MEENVSQCLAQPWGSRAVLVLCRCRAAVVPQTSHLARASSAWASRVCSSLPTSYDSTASLDCNLIKEWKHIYFTKSAVYKTVLAIIIFLSLNSDSIFPLAFLARNLPVCLDIHAASALFFLLDFPRYSKVYLKSTAVGQPTLFRFGCSWLWVFYIFPGCQ